MTTVDAHITGDRGVGLTWSLGLIVSLATHAGAAVLMAVMLQPDPVVDQPPPKSQLRIETQEVAQSQATAQAPKETAAAAASAKGAQVSAGEVPQSSAKAAPLPEQVAVAAPPRAEKLAQSAPPAISKPLTVTEQALPSVETTAALVKPATAPTETIAAAQPTAAAVRPTTAPTQTIAAVQSTAAAAKPVTDASPVQQPEPNTGATVAEAAPDAQPVAAADAGGDHMVAALAWSGGADAKIDAQSLKAIQSFMQPGDTASRSDDVHDALTSLLSSVPCARLQAEFNPETGSLELRGHVPDEADRAPILAKLQAQLGDGIKVADAMLILPAPQCGALSGIADVGLPQSTDQNTNPKIIGADAQARAYNYTTGQTISLDIGAPDYDAYLYVDYFDAAGQVIHFIPNDSAALELSPAKSSKRIPLVAHGQPVTVGPPYGQEIATAFAASSPLYDGLRPLTEPAGPYLDWLKTRVAEARAKDPNFKGEWVYFFVSTRN